MYSILYTNKQLNMQARDWLGGLTGKHFSPQSILDFRGSLLVKPAWTHQIWTIYDSHQIDCQIIGIPIIIGIITCLHWLTIDSWRYGSLNILILHSSNDNVEKLNKMINANPSWKLPSFSMKMAFLRCELWLNYLILVKMKLY